VSDTDRAHRFQERVAGEALQVRHVVLDLVAGGSAALVALALEGQDGPEVVGAGVHRVVCSCGGGPHCAHVEAALAWVGRLARGREPARVDRALAYESLGVDASATVVQAEGAPAAGSRSVGATFLAGAFPPQWGSEGTAPFGLVRLRHSVLPEVPTSSSVNDTVLAFGEASTLESAPSDRTAAGDRRAALERGAASKRVPNGAELATAVEDLVTEVARAGLPAAARALSVDEAVRRIVAAAPAPLPATLSRFVGRLREALESGDAETTARLLDGAARLADALREPDARVVAAWVGVAAVGSLLGGREDLVTAPSMPGTAGVAVERLYDVQLVEVAREWLQTFDRAGLERRWLVELGGGVIYREERLRGAPPPSLGPCPRTLRAALAEVEPGPPPRRVRLLQYEVAAGVDAGALAAVEGHAVVHGETLAVRLRESLGAAPATAEPFALVRPLALEERGRNEHALVLEDDTEVALADEPAGVAAALARAAAERTPQLVAGRLLVRDGLVVLAPLSAIVEGPSLRRLA
jgi:hypothetical protein